MIRIRLDWVEMFAACATGVARRIGSIHRGYNKNKHADESNFQTDICGAIAEACFAKHMGMFFGCSVNMFKAPDVGEWQVRSTSYLDGHLIIRPNDETNAPVAFMICNGEWFGADLVGWFMIDEAKCLRFWREDKNSWWVPQCDLHLFDDDPATRSIA